MGYWEQDEQGHSFSEASDESTLLWGDAPADAVDTLLDQVTALFVMDIGRLPSRTEVLAGIKFSTRVLDLPDKPEDCPVVTEQDRELVEANYYKSFHRSEPGAARIPEWRVLATRAIGEVLHRLREPFKKGD